MKPDASKLAGKKCLSFSYYKLHYLLVEAAHLAWALGGEHTLPSEKYLKVNTWSLAVPSMQASQAERAGGRSYCSLPPLSLLAKGCGILFILLLWIDL